MEPIKTRSWKLRNQEPSPALVEHLCRELKICPLTARALILREIDTPVAAEDFLEARLADLPDPDLLPDMAIACGRLEMALLRGERIAVHGDYDVDGITGCSLLVETLRKLGGQVEYHIPLRMKDGYGLSADAIRQASENGCDLIVSVDCGVSAHLEADLAAELGIDLIITDHHQPPDDLPTCLALVNPHLSSNRFPWKDLSGVGVAFFLLAGLRRRLRENGFFGRHPEPDLRQGLDLVALGTIADIVPLGGVNRTLVRAGLRLLEQGTRAGIRALKTVAEVKQISCGVVGFRLAPRLNAAGRLEDAALGVELLLGEDPQSLQDLAELLDGFNRERQQIEQKTLEQALAALEQMEEPDPFSIVLADERWHSGVIGIVASRLVERYHRPTVMIALEAGQGKGSARSIRNFHLYEALQGCGETLLGFGGHAMAAGLTIEKERLSDFQSSFEHQARSLMTAEDLLPQMLHDGEISLAELSLPQVEELSQLSPFGIGNPQPAFVSRDCRVLAPRLLGEKHVKFAVEQNGCRVGCIAFGMAERFDELASNIDLLYRPTVNNWRGQTSLQLQVMDFCRSGVAA